MHESLVFFFGALFYPKDLKKNCCSKQVQAKIDKIHGCLSNFTIAKLDFLYSWVPFRWILHHFMKEHKEAALKTNTTFREAYTDF